MAKYKIDFNEDAKSDFDWYDVYERKMILSGIKEQLLYEPLTETKNRKMLRENPLAPWELRIGKYRVFYHVDNDSKIVIIISIGHKEHNVLFIQGQEVEL